MLRRLTVLTTLGCLLAVSSPAAAHEQLQVGRYTIEVGWRDEPALEGVPNAVQLEVHETATNQPVEGLSKALHVAVSFGGGTQTFQPALRAMPSEPATYFGDFIPTRTGEYVFRVTGRIGDLAIDERFESGPGRFDPVTAPAAQQFPDQVGGTAGAARDIRALRESADQTRAVTLVGVTLAALSLGMSALALRRTSRRRRSVGSSRPE